MEEIQIHTTFEYDQASGVGFEYNVKVALVWGGNSMGNSHIELAVVITVRRSRNTWDTNTSRARTVSRVLASLLSRVQRG